MRFSGFSINANEQRSETFTAAAGDNMDPESAHEETKTLYIPLHEAGKGTCGNVTFCVRRRSTADSPKTNPIAPSPVLVAVKVPSREMCRDRIADEIIALQRIRSFFTADNNKIVSKHFPTLIDCDPIKDGGSRWLAVSPIRGFDLERLRIAVTEIVQSSSHTKILYDFPYPAIPEVLVLHITKQLTEAVGWLHEVANISHNDVFGGNVMLEVSVASSKRCSFTMPTVVLIDFDRASLEPNDVKRDADRSFVYELIYMLDSAGRAPSQEINPLMDAIAPKRMTTWWDVFRSFLVVNKSTCHQEESSTFAKFWKQLGADIDRRLEDMTDEEAQLVQKLLDMVLENKVRFPTEERIEKVLRQ